MNITRKEFIQGLKSNLKYQGIYADINTVRFLMDYIELHMVPVAIPVKVGSRNGLDITHNINKFRSVHKKCVD